MRFSTVRWPVLALASVLAACAAPGGSPITDLSPTGTSAPETPARTAAAVASVVPSASSGPPPANLVSIGDRALWLECTGDDGPAIVLESGLGGDHRTWKGVQPELASSARVCAYDRAGIGESDSSPGTRTAAAAVDDLHALLDAAGVQPPYVLVGFSFGGAISQLYASMHPDQIAGLVLVESSHPLEAAQFEEHLTPTQIAEDRAAVLDNPEQMDVFASFDELQAAEPLPNVPLVVVTAGISEGWPPDWDAATFDALRAAQQVDLVSFTEQGSQLIAEDSGHHVPSQEPEIVIAAIARVLDALRD